MNDETETPNSTEEKIRSIDFDAAKAKANFDVAIKNGFDNNPAEEAFKKTKKKEDESEQTSEGKEGLAEFEKVFWSEVRDADQKLRRKFGSHLTDWKPTPENTLFLTDKKYRAQLEEWGASVDSQEAALGYTYHPNATIAFNTTKLSQDLQFFKLLATHEMIHVHTLTSSIPIEVEMLPSYLRDPAKDWSGGLEKYKWVLGNDALEQIAAYLAVKSLDLLEQEDIVNRQSSYFGAVFNAELVQNILVPVGESADIELFELLRGVDPQVIKEKLQDAYGLDGYNQFLIPTLAGIHIAETDPRTMAAWRGELLRIRGEALSIRTKRKEN